MATKYVRKSYREQGLGEAARIGAPYERHRLSQRLALKFVYLGIAAFAIVLAFSQFVLPRMQFEGQPILQSPAVVIAIKPLREARQYRVGVEVIHPDGRVFHAYASMDEAACRGFKEGDAVTVRYQAPRWGRAVRLRSIGELR